MYHFLFVVCSNILQRLSVACTVSDVLPLLVYVTPVTLISLSVSIRQIGSEITGHVRFANFAIIICKHIVHAIFPALGLWELDRFQTAKVGLIFKVIDIGAFG